MPKIKNHVVDYFMALYSEPGFVRPKLDVMMLKSLSNSQQKWLEKPFEESEVKKVIWSIEDDEALGLDGFTMAF